MTEKKKTKEQIGYWGNQSKTFWHYLDQYQSKLTEEKYLDLLKETLDVGLREIATHYTDFVVTVCENGKERELKNASVKYVGPCLWYNRQLYRYAINGIIPSYISKLDPCHADMAILIGHCTGILESVEGFDSGNLSGLCDEEVRVVNHIVILTAYARAYIDAYRIKPSPGYYLTITQLALLARMKESTVRNYANPKHKETFETIKEGGNTYVPAEVAIEWLKGRSRYTETKLPDDEAFREQFHECLEYIN